jgi:hypothetical protein
VADFLLKVEGGAAGGAENGPAAGAAEVRGVGAAEVERPFWRAVGVAPTEHALVWLNIPSYSAGNNIWGR